MAVNQLKVLPDREDMVVPHTTVSKGTGATTIRISDAVTTVTNKVPSESSKQHAQELAGVLTDHSVSVTVINDVSDTTVTFKKGTDLCKSEHEHIMSHERCREQSNDDVNVNNDVNVIWLIDEPDPLCID